MVDGIVSNLISQGILGTIGRAWARIWRWRYVQVFGSDVTRGNLHLVYGALTPPACQDAQGNPPPFFFMKPGSQYRISTSVAIPSCEMRAAKYLAESVGAYAGNWAVITSDIEIQQKQDISFVSFGILSNLKTVQLLENSANLFATYEQGRFVSKISRRTLIRARGDEDFGLIVKVSPSNLPKRTWICCGRFGEWGTSGAAWYLSRKWKEVRAKFGSKAFAVIVRVKPGSDESAEPIVMASTPEEIERYTRE